VSVAIIAIIAITAVRTGANRFGKCQHKRTVLQQKLSAVLLRSDARGVGV